MEDPYPFSARAMVAMTYNRFVTQSGVNSWHYGLNEIIETIIADFIPAHSNKFTRYIWRESLNFLT